MMQCDEVGQGAIVPFEEHRARRRVQSQYAVVQDGLKVLHDQLEAFSALPQFASTRALSAAVRVLSQDIYAIGEADQPKQGQLMSTVHVLTGLSLAINHVLSALETAPCEGASDA